MKKIKVIVVDDSALMRRIISDIINSEHDMEVIDIAKNGKELLEKITLSRPDVITLDVEMPIMDGMEALREIKQKNINIPVIMLSSISARGTELTMECLETGAFDFIAKPSGRISLDLDKIKDNLLERIRLAHGKSSINGIVKTNVENKKNSNPSINTVLKDNKIVRSNIEAVVIGASTGGPKALYTVITALPANLGVPVFVVQHMPAGFTKAFADRLNTNSELRVTEAVDEEKIEKNVVYIAPGGYHMQVAADKKIHLNKEPSIWGVRPAVDKLFKSAADVYKSAIVSAVLTGMGRDGAQGTVEIKKNGGITISEDQSTCTIYGMPKAAFETGMVDVVLPLEQIPIQIVKLILK